MFNNIIYVYTHINLFYTASYYGKNKYQKYYDKVLKVIEKNDVTLISPEKENYRDLLPTPLKKESGQRGKIQDRRIHYEAIRHGILWADAVIIEASNEDFQLGHEATLAIQSKKPVLCVSIHEDFSEKINHRYFYGAKYNEHNIYYIVTTFLDRARRKFLSERFNFFLSPRQLQYMEKAASKNSMNTSEYLRRLIDKDMEPGP